MGYKSGVGSLVGNTLTFSIGSHVLSQPQFGSIGQQGASALQAGSRIALPTTGLLLGARLTGKHLKKLKRSF